MIGSGAREHALCWKLAQSPSVLKLYCAPGNAGTAQVAENVALDPLDIPGLVDFAEHEGIDLTVVGPEKPLLAGIVDAFEASGLRIFGPSREPAQLEGSKIFSKELMRDVGIPTARFEAFDSAESALGYLATAALPIVVKADGEAGGKGVTVARTRKEAEEAVRTLMESRVFGESGARITIEECLVGPEVSVLAFVDGDAVKPMLAIQDHKRAGEGDVGPNTGGMGAYAPVPACPPALVETIVRTILRPAVEAIRETGIPFRGLLFAGVMLTDDGPKCIEFNVRFGDPECQVAMTLLEGDLAEILLACVEGRLEELSLPFSSRASMTVVMASGGYPGAYETGYPIFGLDAAAKLDAVQVFHAGTKLAEDGRILTAGGRVLSITATGETLAEARERAYAAVEKIRFEGANVRRDIGWRALQP